MIYELAQAYSSKTCEPGMAELILGYMNHLGRAMFWESRNERELLQIYQHLIECQKCNSLYQELKIILPDQISLLFEKSNIDKLIINERFLDFLVQSN